MVVKAQSTKYVEERYRDYSMYILLDRAMPAGADGMITAGRRALWMARDGKVQKVATLAGATMSIHPHAECSHTICTLTGPYRNNQPLFEGTGAFGTLLNPTEYGAPRYTSVTVSEFTKDVIFKDIEIIPMKPSYDNGTEEPKHFLPLIPMALVNPVSGNAVGFRADIVPRHLGDLIECQIAFLKGKKHKSPIRAYFKPLDDMCVSVDDSKPVGGKTVKKAYVFEGKVIRVDATTAKITKLPYGLSHNDATATLNQLMDGDDPIVIDVIDASRKEINITVKFARGKMPQDHSKLMALLKLTSRIIENPNIVNIAGTAVQPLSSANIHEFVEEFTAWRLGWYVNRFERLKNLVLADIQRYLDIRTAITKNVSASAKKTPTREALKTLLTSLGIVNIDYIADLPVYRFTNEEYLKNEERLKKSELILTEYQSYLDSESKRKQLYIKELQEVFNKYCK